MAPSVSEPDRDTRESPVVIPDPRAFPATGLASSEDQALYRLAAACLGAETGQQADALGRELRHSLARRLRGDGDVLAATFAGAPSVAVARLLWRLLDAEWRGATHDAGDGAAVTLFAIPLVIVVGSEQATGSGMISGELADCAALAAILIEHGALAGNRSLALANVLAGTAAIDLSRLPRLLEWQRLPEATAANGGNPARSLAPAPLACHAGGERVHLRFLIGTAIAKPGLDLLTDASVGRWAAALTQELARQLGRSKLTVLALPRAAQPPLRALQQGRAAQREASAQVFASNAIRHLRARVGEPSAVLSAHRAADAPGGGELRLSLSSPYEPRDAEGFRCPLFALDRVDDVATMLLDLMRDCRVAEVRVLRGVYPDRAPATGLPLLFKPDTIPDGEAGVVH